MLFALGSRVFHPLLFILGHISNPHHLHKHLIARRLNNTTTQVEARPSRYKFTMVKAFSLWSENGVFLCVSVWLCVIKLFSLT